MACKDKKKFVTAEAASKSSLRTKGVIDRYLNILNLNEFRKLNRSWSDYAKEKFKTKGMLFDEWNNRAIPNTKEFTKIDNKKGIYYNPDNIKNTVQYQKLPNEVNKSLKPVGILLSLNEKQKAFFNSFNNGKLTSSQLVDKLQFPKEYKQLTVDTINELEGNINPEQLAIELAAKYSYSVEINITKETPQGNNTIEGYNTNNVDLESLKVVEDDFGDYMIEDKNGQFLTPLPFDTKEEAEKALKNIGKKPSQYYSNLTVSGGTNYTENEIATPAITPNIKGHAQFSTDNGIGWFRSDEQSKLVDNNKEIWFIVGEDGSSEFSSREEAEKELPNYPKDAVIYKATENDLSGGIPVTKDVVGTKTRRILEVQSDLFQKGRNNKDLVTNEYSTIGEKNEIDRVFIEKDGKYFFVDEYAYMDGTQELTEITKENYDSRYDSLDKSKKPDNQFLQLLNKNNNWVTFFVKSIIQDSAKKGYEKVLFPKGDTAAKIEGHTTLEEFKKEKDARIKELEKEKEDVTHYKGIATFRYKTRQEAQNAIKNNSQLYDYIKEVLTNEVRSERQIKAGWGEIVYHVAKKEDIVSRLESKNQEIKQLKQEIADVESGQTQLSSIAKFYEETIFNILKKNGYNPVKITDENGNTWNEVTLDKTRDLKTIMLQKKLEAEELAAEEYRNDVYQELFGTTFKEFYNVVKEDVKDSDTSFMKQAKILARNFGINITFNEKLQSSGMIKYDKDGKVTIVVNPNYLQEDTLSHEYGHLLIDIIGLDNMRIQAALEKLKDSNLEKEVMDKYPELQGDMLKREILATALGKKGIDIFNNLNDRTWWDRFTDWFFNLIGVRFKNDEIAKLARELWNPSTSYLNKRVNVELEQLQKMMTHEKEIEANDLKSILTKYRDVLTVKVNRWKNNTAADSKNYTNSINELIPDIENFLVTNQADGIINLVDNAYNQFNQLKKRIAEDDLTSETLVTIKSFIRSFEPLKELNSFIKYNKKDLKLPDAVIAEIETKLNELVNNEQDIERQILKLSKTIIATKFSKLSSRVERIYENREEQRLKKENPEISNSELEDKLIQHIEDNKDIIEKQNYQYFYNVLEESVDIEKIWKILDSGQVNSSLIQITQKILDRADTNISSKYNSARVDIKNLKDEYDLINNSVNQEEKFKRFIYQGEESDYLVGEYDPKFLDIHTTLLNAKIKESEKIEEGDEAPAAKAYDKWAKENIVVEYKPVDGVSTRFEKPADKWKTKLDLTTKEKELLEKIKQEFRYRDKQIINSNASLINNKFSTEFIKLPQQEKSNAQRVRESGLINTITRATGDITKRRNTDLDLNNSTNQEEILFHKRGFGTEDNKADYRVPVYYRKKIKKEDRSRDLFTLMLANAWTSTNYFEKTMVASDLELLSDVLEEKKYTKSSNSKYWVNALNKNQTLDAETNREFQMLRSIIEDRLYGLGEIEQVLFGNVSANKINNFMNGWASSVMLGLNYMSAVPNFAMGKAMSFVEGVGGLIYDRQNLRNAEKAYWGDLTKIMGDFNSVRPLSKTNVLLDYFEILNDSSSMNTKFVDDGSFRSKMKKDSIFFLSHTVEHNVQATQMYAVLDALEHKGDKLIDLMYVDKGELKFKKPIPEVLLNKAKSRIKKVVADGQGQYDQRMKSAFQREWYGKSAIMYRKWIPRGVTKRFKGFKNIAGEYADFENSNDFENFYSEESEMFEEGHYVSFLRMLHKDFKTYKFNYLKKYKSLTRYEQANVRKTLAEMSIALGMLILTTTLANLASDEDDEATQRALYMGAYWSRRTYSEIRFFSSVPDALKILQSPAASLTLVENMFDVLFIGDEQYQKNYRDYKKGDYKIFKELKDITPLRNQLFKYENPEDALSFLTK